MIKKLGEGAFGVVKLAKDKKTGLERAIKRINKVKAGIKTNNKEMEHEVNLLRNTDHPNILKVYEQYDDYNNIDIVTEVCSGGELSDLFKINNNITEKTIASIINQILYALVYCHGKNIIHRDLKEANVMLKTQ